MNAHSVVNRAFHNTLSRHEKDRTRDRPRSGSDRRRPKPPDVTAARRRPRAPAASPARSAAPPAREYGRREHRRHAAPLGGVAGADDEWLRLHGRQETDDAL